MVFHAQIRDFLKKKTVFVGKKSQILNPENPLGLLLGGPGAFGGALERLERARRMMHRETRLQNRLLGAILRRLGGFLGRLGGLLEPSGGVWGSFGRVLGTSWRHLEWFLEALEACMRDALVFTGFLHVF